MNPKEELIGWCSNTSSLKSTPISSHVNAIAGTSRPAAWRTRCKKRSRPLPQPKTPNNLILTTVETPQPNITLSLQDYWTAHYFWRTWMPELHQQPFVLVVDTVAHGAAHAYVAKQITLYAARLYAAFARLLRRCAPLHESIDDKQLTRNAGTRTATVSTR